MESSNRSIPLFISSSSMNWTHVEGNVDVPEEVPPSGGCPTPPWGPAVARPPSAHPYSPRTLMPWPHGITPTPHVAPVPHQHPQHPAATPCTSSVLAPPSPGTLIATVGEVATGGCQNSAEEANACYLEQWEDAWHSWGQSRAHFPPLKGRQRSILRCRISSHANI